MTKPLTDRELLLVQGWKEQPYDNWEPPTSFTWIKFDKAISVAKNPKYQELLRILGLRCDDQTTLTR